MPLWHRVAVIGVVLLVTAIVARLLDRRIARRDLPPEAVTRYRVLRRSITTAVVLVGVLSALLVIPQIRAVAGGILASSAVVGIVIGFASQRTIGNFVAGLLIALSQPVRLGDRVVVDGKAGEVEEIGLTYTFIRTDDDSRLVLPNEKLAADAILNRTIRRSSALAEVTIQVPLDCDLESVVELVDKAVREEERSEERPDERPDERPKVLVTGLEGNATVMLRAEAPDATKVEELASNLRRRAHKELLEAGVYAS
jgi:small-conductance mechanosensitive channel